LTLRQKATSAEASIYTMTIDACQSIAASSQLLCLISIRLIDLDLPVSGNHVSPPSPQTAVRSVQPDATACRSDTMSRPQGCELMR
jgi:hypothetical protein